MNRCDCVYCALCKLAIFFALCNASRKPDVIINSHPNEKTAVISIECKQRTTCRESKQTAVIA